MQRTLAYHATPRNRQLHRYDARKRRLTLSHEEQMRRRLLKIYSDYKKPFIFANFNGSADDVDVMTTMSRAMPILPAIAWLMKQAADMMETAGRTR